MLATGEDLEVVGQAGSGEEAVALAGKVRPDVVLLDIEMPGMGARGAMNRLYREFLPPPKVVIVTMHDDPRLVREFFAAGASAYLVKSASIEELLSAVRAAVGSPESDGEDRVMIVPREVLESAEEGSAHLSARELEVLLQTARGMSNRQIGHSLHVSEATVKRHLANIYPKLGVSSRTEATRKALSEGWISTYDLTA